MDARNRPRKLKKLSIYCYKITAVGLWLGLVLVGCSLGQEEQPYSNPSSTSFLNPHFDLRECTAGLNPKDAVEKMKDAGLSKGPYYQYIGVEEGGVPYVLMCREQDYIIIKFTKLNGVDFCNCIGERL